VTEKSYLDHCLTVHNDRTPFKCRGCDTRFKFNYYRSKHERRHGHAPDGEENNDEIENTSITTKDIATSDTTQPVAKTAHIQHGLPFACIECNASYNTEHELISHVTSRHEV
jgi:hypothetical protein